MQATLTRSKFEECVSQKELGRAILDFLKPYPITLGDPGPKGPMAMISAKPTGIQILWGIDAGPAFMLAHELGHIAAATDEELHMPNLGLEVNRSGDNKVLRAAVVPEPFDNERRALAFHLNIVRALHSGLWAEARIGRVSRVARSVFNLKPGVLEATMDDPTYSFDSFKLELERKLSLL